ncbi:MAG: PTS sugar transporter subunit IIA, partial [Glutamicibacter sp.]
TQAGRAASAAELAEHALAREAKTATGVPGGIAIPHCRSAAVTVPTLAMARLGTPVDFGAKDGPADLVFFIAAPEGADKEHLKLLSKLARALVKKPFTAALRAARSNEEIVALVSEVLSDAPAAPAAPAAAPAATARPKIVAVTACPTGIAHTYMAADSLAQAAEELGIDFAVETQGSSGSKPLDQALITQ